MRKEKYWWLKWSVVACIILILINLMLLHEAWDKFIDNLLNGGIAIIPATIIVIWQVRKENEIRKEEERKNHDREIERINRNHQVEMSQIKREHHEEIKKFIYEMLACMNEFPNLFEIKYRISIVAQQSDNYERILSSRDDIVEFKKELHEKSINLQSRLIYLADKRDQQENLINIIQTLNEIESNIQRFIRILNIKQLKGGLGYSERDYEKVITSMYNLEKCLSNLPADLSLNSQFMNASTMNLNYYAGLIDIVDKNLNNIYRSENKLTVSILKQSVIENLDNKSLKDCLKIWAIRNDRENRDYRYISKARTKGEEIPRIEKVNEKPL